MVAVVAVVQCPQIWHTTSKQKFPLRKLNGRRTVIIRSINDKTSFKRGRLSNQKVGWSQTFLMTVFHNLKMLWAICIRFENLRKLKATNQLSDGHPHASMATVAIIHTSRNQFVLLFIILLTGFVGITAIHHFICCITLSLTGIQLGICRRLIFFKSIK